MRIITQTVILFYLFLFVKAEGNDGIENYLGSKSAYRYVANLDYRNEDIDGCAKKIWMFVRHGTRYPSPTDIGVMRRNLTRLRNDILGANRHGGGSLEKSDLLLFEKWYPRVEEYEAKMLTVEGESEMLELAERMQARFPKLLKPVYSNTSYVFKHTKTQRTEESANYFATGLFGKNVLRDIHYPTAVSRDPILRFYKLCNKWANAIKKNSKTYTERNNFDNTEVMKRTLDKISAKLGIQTLTVSDLHSMYITCAFENSWSKQRRSPWCIPFDTETIKVLEYAEDLKYYWVDGYGYNLTCRQACPAFHDMFQFINSKEEYPNALFYFSHSGALLKLLCHLGIHQDDAPLMASDFDVNADRKWRVSKIDPFGNNLAFVLYECNGMRKLLTLHNEKAVRLPACPYNDFCDMSSLEKYYKDSLSCGFDKMCENNIPPAA